MTPVRPGLLLLAALCASAQDAPTWPETCNATHLQFDSWRALQYYAQQNFACLSNYGLCTAGSLPKTTSCDYYCTAGAPAFSHECAVSGDTACEVVADNPAPTTPGWIPYHFEYEFCLPRAYGCDASFADPITRYWQAAICGVAGADSPDCKVTVTCAFDNSGDYVWPIVGGVVGSVAALASLGFLWFRWQQRREFLAGLQSGNYAEQNDDDGDSDDGDGFGGAESGRMLGRGAAVPYTDAPPTVAGHPGGGADTDAPTVNV